MEADFDGNWGENFVHASRTFLNPSEPLKTSRKPPKVIKRNFENCENKLNIKAVSFLLSVCCVLDSFPCCSFICLRCALLVSRYKPGSGEVFRSISCFVCGCANVFCFSLVVA